MHSAANNSLNGGNSGKNYLDSEPTEMEVLKKSQEDGSAVAGGDPAETEACLGGPTAASAGPKAASKRRGCFVTVPVLVVLILLVTFLCALVGLIVYFTTNRDHWSRQPDKKNTYGSNLLDVTEEEWNRCVNISIAKQKCLTNLNDCPNRNDTKKKRRKRVVDVRLPTDVKPEFYKLELQAHLHEGLPANFFFNGTTDITVMCYRATSVIFVHAFSLNVTVEMIKVLRILDDYEMTLKNISYDLPRQWYKLELTETLQAGQRYMLRFGAFQGPLMADLKGWYLSSYEENNQTKYLATSQLQPTDARKVFPSFDEPAFKAQFEVILIRRENFHSLSNMPLRKTHDRGNGWKADSFQPTLKVSTYLLAFIVSEFKNLSAFDSKGRRFTVWSRPDVIQTAKYSMDIGIKILEFFEDFFKVKYPLNKTDMVAVPDFAAGAMENWGLMIYRELTMLWDPSVGSASSKQKVATVVSHEIAHQWFGNLVTLDWWDDLWLNEGFASFIEYVGVGHVHANWMMDEQFALNDLQRVLVTDSLMNSHPVLMPVFNPDEINDMFDTISYNKGASVLRMMEAFLGANTFRNGLQRYLSKHKYNNTVHDDLWRSLTEAAKVDNKNIDVKAVMDTWIKQMGYPLVTVQRIPGTNKVQLAQEHFVLNASEIFFSHPSPYNFTWKIPITYASKSNKQWKNTERVYWLNEKSQVMTLENTAVDDWMIFNLEQAGFYRVHYDEENWNRIIDQLKTNHKVIPFKHRAQLVDDLFNLGKGGIVNYTMFMDLTEYLKKEIQYVPWEAAVRVFNYIDSMFALDEYYGHFQAYIRDLIDPFYKTVSWDDRESDTHIDNLIRPLAITTACKSGHKGCISEAKKRFKIWIQNTTLNQIPTSLRTIIYCIGIQTGSVEEWHKLFEEVQKTKHEDELSRMMRALGCSKEVWILKKYLGMTITDKRIKSQDLMDILIGISKNPAGKYLAWEFLRQHWKTVLNEETNQKMRFIMRILLQYGNLIVTTPGLNELIMFRNFAKEYGMGMNERSFAQAIEHAKHNVQWVENYRDTIGQWLVSRSQNKK